jgi:3',5'-cyclic AMP phosphodiesterase CpdA
MSWRRKRRLVHQRTTLDAVVSAAQADAPEHWCITGDLTHIGHEHELSEALAWLQSLGDGETVSVIPGNHDVYIPSRSEAALQRLWAPYLPDPKEPWPRLQLRGAVALITVNSGHAAPPAFATGGLGTEQLQRLRDLLRAAGAAGYARVIMIHHAPGPGMDKWRKRLVDAEALASLLAETGAELILHGHCHESLSRSIAGPLGIIPVLSAPSASATGERGCRKAGYNRLTITVGEREVHLAGDGLRLDEAPNWHLETRLNRPGNP